MLSSEDGKQHVNKKKATAWMKQTLTEMYEKEYGKKPQGIEVW